jgi:hypothetical protein
MQKKYVMENPEYVAIIISEPLTAFINLPYKYPKAVANATAAKTAAINHNPPDNPDSIGIIIARSPQTIPIGKAKFNPMPDWMEGAIESTSNPHMPNRIIVSDSKPDNE